MSVSNLLSTAELTQLEARAFKMGVNLDVSFDTEDGEIFIWLGLISRDGGEPGSGKVILEELCELADEAELPIRGAVLWWNSRLLDYYADFGFEVIKHADPDDDRNDHSIIEREAA